MRAKRQFAQTAATRLLAGDPFEIKDLIVRTEHGKVLAAPANCGKRRRRRRRRLLAIRGKYHVSNENERLNTFVNVEQWALNISCQPWN